MNVTVMEPPSTGGHEVGACVTHKDQPMPSLVMKKIVASNGTEMYVAKSYAYEDKEELRLCSGFGACGRARRCYLPRVQVFGDFGMPRLESTEALGCSPFDHSSAAGL